MDPNRDWQARMLIPAWSYDIQIQTILALIITDLIASIADAFICVICCGERAVPFSIYGFWVREAKVFDGRLSKGDTEEEILVVG